MLPHDTKPHIPNRSPAPLIFRLGRGHLYSRYWARLRIGFCQLGSRSESLLRTRPCKSKISKSATEPLGWGGAVGLDGVDVVLPEQEPNLPHSFAAHFVVVAAQQHGEPGNLGQLHKLREVGQGAGFGHLVAR